MRTRHEPLLTDPQLQSEDFGNDAGEQAEEREMLKHLGLHLTQERGGARLHGSAFDDPFFVWEPDTFFRR